MRKVKVRATTQVPNEVYDGWTGRHLVMQVGPMAVLPKSPFGVYKNEVDAAQDIVLWMQYNGFKTAFPTLKQFVQEMKQKGYMGKETADSYYKKVMTWKEVN